MNLLPTESIQLQEPDHDHKNLPINSLFTLLILATDLDKGARCQQLAQLIAKKFPCKIIFAILDTFHPENTLLINRSVMTTKNGGEESISCDLLTIQASLDEAKTLPFLILPEILADLPVYLLTTESPSDLSPLLEMLEPHINKTIFEMGEKIHYPSFASSLFNYAKKIPLVDLQWARTEPWRITIAHVFHSVQKMAQLHKVEKIEIRYVQRKERYGLNTETQAMFLQAWLATRLGWKPKSVESKKGTITITYETDQKNSFLLQLLPSESSFLEEGVVESIEMTTVDGYHFLMTYENDDRHIINHSSSNDRCELPIIFFVGNLQRGSTLIAELFQPFMSSHYLPVLEYLKNPLWEKVHEKK